MDAIKRSVELTEAERINRLRLIRSYNVGPRGIMAQTPQGGRDEPGPPHQSFFRCGWGDWNCCLWLWTDDDSDKIIRKRTVKA